MITFCNQSTTNGVGSGQHSQTYTYNTLATSPVSTILAFGIRGGIDITLRIQQTILPMLLAIMPVHDLFPIMSINQQTQARGEKMADIAYYRVSTQKQGQSGLGLEAQKAAVERYAEAHDMTITRAFTEIETGTNKR